MLAGVVPLIVLTAIVTISLARQQQAAVDRGLSDTLTALATAVQNDLETSIKSPQTLATSQRLDDDDLPRFYEQEREVARRIRAQHGGRRILLIAITGYGREEDRRRALQAGFDAHVTKPVSPERLRELITGIAGNSAGSR